MKPSELISQLFKYRVRQYQLEVLSPLVEKTRVNYYISSFDERVCYESIEDFVCYSCHGKEKCCDRQKCYDDFVRDLCIECVECWICGLTQILNDTVLDFIDVKGFGEVSVCEHCSFECPYCEERIITEHKLILGPDTHISCNDCDEKSHELRNQ
jgi:hypothetical protein